MGYAGFFGEYRKRTEPLWIQGKVRFCWILVGNRRTYVGEEGFEPSIEL